MRPYSCVFVYLSGSFYRSVVKFFQLQLARLANINFELEQSSTAESMLEAAQNWGTGLTERQLAYPCDDVIPHPDATLFRGVTINASAANIFRWLCQMRVAPYSYDWIDNGGKRSPRRLIPGLDELIVAQEFMTIFTLVSFERNCHLTLRTKTPSRAAKVFGDVVVSYFIVERSANSCRLLVKLIVKYPPTARGRFMRAVLPWGDLIMMRRQLLNFKQLAENYEG